MMEKLQNEECYLLYASLNVTRAIKSRIIRWTGYVAFMGETRNASKFWSDKLKGRAH